MALINCPECGKEVSDKAVSCPYCGIPISPVITNNNQQGTQEEYLCCPKCQSKDLHAEKKGFSGGKALVGGLLTGGIGLLAGTIGSRDINITCLKCGNKFKAGNALVVPAANQTSISDIDDELLVLINAGALLEAVKVYKEKMNVSIIDAKRHVDNLQSKYSPRQAKSKSGCAGIIVLIIAIGSIMALFV